MNIIEIIEIKKHGGELSQLQINDFVNGYVNQQIPDYQASALLMAIYFQGLSIKETYFLTKAMLKSGKEFILKKNKSHLLIDKHSTGGVGDKVSLILTPILACLGFKVSKLSGRGLGFTGGTIDKLESINVNTNITLQQANKLLTKVGAFIAQQQKELVPADKLLYALRDVTATIDSNYLIAASILSKKFSLNSDYIFLDIKYGNGAFFKSLKHAQTAKELFLNIAKMFKRKLYCHLSSMEQPLGRAIGNLLEIKETLEFLSNQSTATDLGILIKQFVCDILVTTKKCNNQLQAEQLYNKCMQSKAPLQKFYDWVKAQHGDVQSLINNTYFAPQYQAAIIANKTGYVHWTDAMGLGLLSVQLGAGRIKKTDQIDYTAGIWLNKQTNEKVVKGEIVATLYSNKKINTSLVNLCQKYLAIENKQINLPPLIMF